MKDCPDSWENIRRVINIAEEENVVLFTGYGTSKRRYISWGSMLVTALYWTVPAAAQCVGRSSQYCIRASITLLGPFLQTKTEMVYLDHMSIYGDSSAYPIALSPWPLFH